MTPLVDVQPAEQTLRELYERYKRLTLAAGAALVLGVPHEPLEHEVAELLADARQAVASTDLHGPQLSACIDAATELHRLLVRGDGRVERVRETHRRLRHEVWKVIPCEYVPCCASTHGHE